MVAKNFIELESYPLLLFKKEGKEYVLSKAQILQSSEEIIYSIKEIELEKDEKRFYYKVLKRIKDKDAEGNLKKEDMQTFFSFASKEIISLAKEVNQELSDYEKIKISYHLYKNYCGFGEIESIWHDKNINFIFCEKVGFPIYVYHKNPRYGFLKTNLKFRSMYEFKNALINLKLKSKMIRDSPEFLGILDNKLIEISDIFNEMSIKTISRLPIAPKDLIKLGIAMPAMMNYLNKMIKDRASVLIIGGNDFQRTELLNSLALLVKKDSKTIVFENYPKIIVPQRNVFYKVLTPYKKKHKKIIDDYLRKNPDFVIADDIDELAPIVKNIKNECQTFVTLDAQTFDEAMNKLGRILPTPAIAFIDIIIIIRERGDGWPKIEEIYELYTYDFKSKKIKVSPVFFLDKRTKKIIFNGSRLLNQNI